MFTYSTKREIRHVHIVVVQKRAKKCTKKAWCTCKVVVLLIKPIVFLTFSLPSALLHLKRDLKIRRRRRQRELQKNNRLRLAKQQLCMCITLFCTFLCRYCTTTTRKCLISRFMEDVNKLLWNFLSHSELGYGFSGIQLQESSSTFDKVSELELSR